jgi:hypothetical protein
VACADAVEPYSSSATSAADDAGQCLQPRRRAGDGFATSRPAAVVHMAAPIQSRTNVLCSTTTVLRLTPVPRAVTW